MATIGCVRCAETHSVSKMHVKIEVHRRPTSSDILRPDFLLDHLQRVTHLLLQLRAFPIGRKVCSAFFTCLPTPLFLFVAPYFTACEDAPGC